MTPELKEALYMTLLDLGVSAGGILEEIEPVIDKHYPADKQPPPAPKLSPTEDLILEVLAARYRTGESLWTFDSRTKKVAEGLASRGLINVLHPIVEKTYRASLTEAGKLVALDPSYVAPGGAK